jgi:hypothetical protein
MIHPPWVQEIVADAENRARMAPSVIEEPESLEWASLDHEPPLVEPPVVAARSTTPAAPARRVTDEGIEVEALDWSTEEEDLVAPPPVSEPPKPRKSVKKVRSGKSKAEDVLQSARAALVEGDVDQAAELYDGLIAKGKLLDEVIDDLDAAALTVPNARRLHELLGQAHTRKGNIPAALEAFRKAMRGE